MIPTPHIDASSKDQIAESILLPGDPLRAKFIADNFLKNTQQFNATRNMLGFTGEYRGKRVSVMGTGMGMPSIALYSYELTHFYDVKRLIRVGSCGALQPDINLFDLVFAMAASHDSSYPSHFNLGGVFAPSATYSLLQQAVKHAEQRQKSYHVGGILSSDIFYSDDSDYHLKWAKMGILAVEMEAASLYSNAARTGAEALCILTVSDSLVRGEKISAQERESSFRDMLEIALELI